MTTSRPSRRTRPSTTLVILGLDPGLERTGYGVVACGTGGAAVVRYGRVETRRNTPLPERLLTLSRGVRKLCAQTKPDLAAVEELFFAKNAKTAMVVGQARGAILVSLAGAGVPVRSFTPPQVKQAVTGYGAAGKEQVQKMVARILGVSFAPNEDDAADALAVALCCAHAARFPLQ